MNSGRSPNDFWEIYKEFEKALECIAQTPPNNSPDGLSESSWTFLGEYRDG